MTGTNHIVTGAVIGAAIAAPAVALPLAFASHFALDALPHFGLEDPMAKKSRRFSIILACDAAGVVLAALAIILFAPSHWPWLLAAGFMAMLPDLMWLPNYARLVRDIPRRPNNKIMHVHKQLQREFEWGLWIEAVWLLAFGRVFVWIMQNHRL